MHREEYLLIALGILVVVGYGFSMDMPQALEVYLRLPPYSFSSFDFNMLYFASFVPIVFTDILIGILLDRVPINRSIVFIATCSFVSQIAILLLFEYRPLGQGYKWLIYVARGVFGVAGSSAFTVQAMIISTYGADHFQTLIGIGMCMPFITDSLNLYLTPLVVEATQSLVFPWVMATSVDFLSLLFSLCIAFLIIRRKNKLNKHQLIDSSSATHQQLPNPKNQTVKVGSGEVGSGEVAGDQHEEFSCTYLKQMQRLFWIVILAVTLSQFVIGGLFSNLNDLLVKRFSIEYVTAGQLLIIPYTGAAVASLTLGKIVNLYPHRRRLIILLMPVFMVAGLLVLYLLPNNFEAAGVTGGHYVGIVFFLLTISLGFGAMYTVLCSSVTLLVDQDRSGTAWGAIGTAIALGETLSPLMNFWVLDLDENLGVSYTLLTLSYLVISVFPLLLGILIYCGPFTAIDIGFGARIEQERRLKESLLEP